jgi:NhaP-type Na+/H+ or K+/H+ antiporter
MGLISISDPALTVAVALAAGMMAQAIAHHLRLPGIVPLLAAGALLGPDLFGILHPEVLGSSLQVLVGYAVAVILFEGGLNLNLGRLRRESAALRQLVTIGALVTAAGGMLAARLILGWGWSLALLFGVLVIVTGPTVITPLLRRVPLQRNLHVILEAEGVLIDPIGAVIAVVTLEVVLHPSGSSLLGGALDVASRLGAGALLGLAGGAAIAFLLRPKHLVPEGLENVFTLAMVLALFHLSNALVEETGLAAVTVAGLTVGNIRSQALSDLMDFKEQLTVLLIGLLFVLLAADVRFEEIRRLGVPGLLTVVALMLVVRPLNVWAGTAGSDLGLRQRLLLSWIAPRGIVAAAVASFFAVALDEAGMPGGAALRAMVFLVIAVTVLVQGVTAGLVAGLLGVKRRTNTGYAILGANELSRALARALRDGGEEVLFLDSNPDATQAAQQDGFRVVFGNALEERTLQRAGLDGLAGCVGLTPNEEVNLLFATKAGEEFKVPRRYVALHLDEGHVTHEMIQAVGGRVLFGAQRDTDLWAVRVRRRLAVPERWRREAEEETQPEEEAAFEEAAAVLPLALYRDDGVELIDEATRMRKGDEVLFLVFAERREEAEAALRTGGWVQVGETEADEDTVPTSQ